MANIPRCYHKTWRALFSLIFRDHGSTQTSGRQANRRRDVNGKRHILKGKPWNATAKTRLASASTAARSAVGNVLDTVDLKVKRVWMGNHFAKNVWGLLKTYGARFVRHSQPAASPVGDLELFGSDSVIGEMEAARKPQLTARQPSRFAIIINFHSRRWAAILADLSWIYRYKVKGSQRAGNPREGSVSVSIIEYSQAGPVISLSVPQIPS